MIPPPELCLSVQVPCLGGWVPAHGKHLSLCPLCQTLPGTNSLLHEMLPCQTQPRTDKLRKQVSCETYK